MPRVSGPFPALCAHRPRSLTTRRLCAPSPPSARGTRVCVQSHVAPEPLPAAAAGPPSLPSPRPLTTAWDALHFLSWPVSLARLSAPRQGLWPLSSPVHHSCRDPVWRRVGPARTGGTRAGAAGWAPLPGGRRPRRGRSLTARLRACRGHAGGGGRRASERPSFGMIVLRLLAGSSVHVSQTTVMSEILKQCCDDGSEGWAHSSSHKWLAVWCPYRSLNLFQSAKHN